MKRLSLPVIMGSVYPYVPDVTEDLNAVTSLMKLIVVSISGVLLLTLNLV